LSIITLEVCAAIFNGYFIASCILFTKLLVVSVVYTKNILEWGAIIHNRLSGGIVVVFYLTITEPYAELNVQFLSASGSVWATDIVRCEGLRKHQSITMSISMRSESG